MTTPATAQSPGSSSPSQPLLLADLHAHIGRGNPRIEAARQIALAGRSRVPGALRPPDPELQFGFMNYALPKLGPMSGVGMAQIQLMQMIPLGGKTRLAGRAAAAQADAADARVEEIGWEIRAAVAMAFYDLYAVEQNIGVARETLRLLQDISETASSMYRVGEGRQSDVLRAHVAIARMAEDTLRMHAMRDAMVGRIAGLLAVAEGDVSGTPVLPRFPVSVPDRAWLDSVGSTGRAMIRSGIDDIRATSASEELARRELVPDLQVGVQYGQRGGEMGGTERMGSLMFGVSIPVFAGDRQHRMRDEASAMRLMAEAEVAAMRAETRGRIAEAHASLTRSRNLQQLYRTTVLPQARAAVAAAMAAYRVGSVDFMTLLDGRMAVNEYRQELHALEADEGKAWAELEMLTGRALVDAGTNRQAAEQDAAGEVR